MDGIWIRNQDKERLYLCKGFYVTEREHLNRTAPFAVIGVVVSEFAWLGYYATKERALQVLDEIQQAITNYANTLEYNKTQANSGRYDTIYPVYEMPAE